MKKEVFGGLTLAGGKRRGTALALISIKDSSNQLILEEIYGNLGVTATQTADQALLRVINKRSDNPTILGVNVPLSLPPCLSCQLPWCPGYEVCEVESVVWTRKSNPRLKKIHKSAKPSQPYTERPVEIFLRENFPHWLDIPGAYSSNMAPLVSRIQYLKRHFSSDTELIEVLPRLTFFKLSSLLGLQPNLAKSYRGPEHGSETRLLFLQKLKEKLSFVIDDRDLELLTLNPPPFDALLAALTAFLHRRGYCEMPLTDFPISEGWVSFPKDDFEFGSLNQSQAIHEH